MKTSTTNNTKTTDALAILNRRVPLTPEMERLLEIERVNADVGQKIYDLRKKAGLTQKQLADKIGTSQSVISELEDASYEGNSLEMLTGVFLALGRRMNISIVSPRTHRRRQLQPA